MVIFNNKTQNTYVQKTLSDWTLTQCQGVQCWSFCRHRWWFVEDWSVDDSSEVNRNGVTVCDDISEASGVR